MGFDGLVTNEPMGSDPGSDLLPSALSYKPKPEVADRLRARLVELIRPYNRRDELSLEESCELSVLYALVFLGNHGCAVMTVWNDFVVPYTPALRDAGPGDAVYDDWWAAFGAAIAAVRQLIRAAQART